MQTRVYEMTGSGLKPLIKPNLQMYQLIWFNGYGECQGSNKMAIIELMDTDHYLHGKAVDITKPNNIHNFQHVKPESQVFGIGYYYFEPIQFATKEQVLNGLNMAAEYEEKQKEIAKQKEITEQKYLETILKDYAHLAKVDKAKYNGRVIGAKNIRTELKAKFPDIKFSVRGDSFAGGDSIDISWTDGPDTKDVEKITDKYQEGHFNGMEDIYNYSNDSFNNLYGGAKYVHCHKERTN